MDSPFEGSPRAGAAEYVQGGDVNRQTIPSPHLADHPISPFEGGWGDVNRQIVTSLHPADRHLSPSY